MSVNFDDPEMQEIFEGFLVETDELLENFLQDMMALEDNADDNELLNKIFRGIHTIKGTSSFMGFEDITKLTHSAEDILNKLRRNEMQVNRDIIDTMIEVHDKVREMIEQLKGLVDVIDYAPLLMKLHALLDGESIDIDDDKSIKKNSMIGDEALNTILDNPDRFSGSGDFDDEELALIQAAFEQLNSDFQDKDTKEELTDNTHNLNTLQQEDQVREQTKENSSTITSPSQNAKETETEKSVATPISINRQVQVANETIRIEVSRIENLMDLSGELVLGRNRLAQITNMLSEIPELKDRVRELVDTTSQIDFITSEIQSAVMKMRMVQIGKLYQKAPRIVRDLSKEFGKQIKLVVKGEETEIDRGIIEELNDPLVHMIRNSCDHGIETAEKRKASGKLAEGTVTLDAYQEGNHIIMKISDDGAGMDPEKLKAKAIEKGVLTPEDAAQMSRREALQIIFLPGFSTAVKVSNVSGRGVGMDVVRTNINKLKGIIEIESELGKGTSFIIKLPLTLAIIQSLMVKTGNETYAIPLSSIDEVVSLEDNSIQSINSQEVIKIRNEVYPLIRLHNLLKCQNDSKDNYVVIAAYGIKRVGLVVESLLGQQEIVIKSLGKFLGQIHGIAGSTILGDGRVVMILDVGDLVQLKDD